MVETAMKGRLPRSHGSVGPAAAGWTAGVRQASHARMDALALTALIEQAIRVLGRTSTLGEVLGVTTCELLCWRAGTRRPPAPLVAALREIAREPEGS